MESIFAFILYKPVLRAIYIHDRTRDIYVNIPGLIFRSLIAFFRFVICILYDIDGIR